jgi:hypothetical protein
MSVIFEMSTYGELANIAPPISMAVQYLITRELLATHLRKTRCFKNNFDLCSCVAAMPKTLNTKIGNVRLIGILTSAVF